MVIKQKYWHALFEASVFIKAINGIWETISGIGILFLSRTSIAHAIGTELPKINQLTSGTREFAGLYILAHGLINIFLAYYLYKEKLWAFWISIGFFSGSIIYLAYRVSISHSIMLYALMLFDLFFIYLTWHEFKYRKKLAANKLQLDTSGVH